MVQTQVVQGERPVIQYHIVAHVKRREMAMALHKKIAGSRIFLDSGKYGAAKNHVRAIQSASDEGWLCVLEDDAQPVAGFQHFVEEWIAEHPNDMASLYLGTGRPKQFQSTIDTLIDQLDIPTTSGSPIPYITLSTLIHGVCYILPASTALEMVQQDYNIGEYPIDFMLGDMWHRATGRQEVLYPVESLVDHADVENVEKHLDNEQRTEARKARKLRKRA